MSSLDQISQKMTLGLDTTSFTRVKVQTPAPLAEADRRISREVAHELNNILTIVRGYADRLILKHGDNPALRPELKIISDNARRAANVIRNASQPKLVSPAN